MSGVPCLFRWRLELRPAREVVINRDESKCWKNAINFPETRRGWLKDEVWRQSGRKTARFRRNRYMTSSWQVWRDKRGRLSWLRVAVLVLLLAPLGKALFDVETIMHGARPINELIHRAGFWALVFLGITLAVTPFRRIARYGNLIDVRRMLYVADQRYDLGKVAYEISHRVYLIIGGIAWLGLAVLAATSTDGMMRRLGGLRWRRLHQIIYAVALLALIHYFQQTKADVTVPVFAAGLFLWLMAYRLLAWWMDTTELSTLSLLGLAVAVSAAT